ncbi:MAG: HAD family phosphatase [Candidatus Diapherotrites archaeon]|nr:HAD family phosphatase [Candidatus Diapherotrites archaeon]
MNKAAIFDLDGTLIEGGIGLLMIMQLFEKLSTSMQMAKTLQKYSDKKVTYDKLARELTLYWAQGAKSLNKKDIMYAAKAAAKQVKLNPGATEIVKAAKKKGYLTILLSLTPQEGLDYFRKRLPFDYAIGTVCSKKGTYTGKLEGTLLDSDGKVSELKRLTKELDLDLKRSFAAGDTMGDYEILNSVGKGFVFGELDSNFKELAKKKKWVHVTDYRDIIRFI